MKRCIVLLSVLVLSLGAQAHTRSASYSQWQLLEQGESHSARLSARVAQRDLSRLALDPRYTPDYAQVAAERILSDLRLSAAGGPCQAREVSARAGSDGWLQLQAGIHCQGPLLALESRLFAEVAPSHLHFVRLTTPEGQVTSAVLDFDQPAMPLNSQARAGAAASQSVLRYLSIGMEHILAGADHLVFIVMLILLARRVREVIWLASVFTLAHSLTLGAAVLGTVSVNGAWVEALIGLSIVLVAAENLWLHAGRDPWIPRLTWLALLAFSLLAWTWLPPLMLVALLLFSGCYFALLARSKRPLRLRLVLVFGFGLVHGLGFAGELLTLELPSGQLLMALLGFNLGVEAGQVLVIALIWPLLLWLRPGTRTGEGLRYTALLMALGLGSFWWVVRLAA